MIPYSDQLDQLAPAIALAQAEIEGAKLDADNPFFKTTYATLASVWSACKPALIKNGLSVLQFSEPSPDGTLALVTMLLHKSGQFIAGTETMPLAKNDPQGYGSAITYARRYGLAAMVGVCPEDDDAEAATHHAKSTARPLQRDSGPKPGGGAPTLTLAQSLAQGTLSEAHKQELRRLGFTSLRDIPANVQAMEPSEALRALSGAA